MLGKVKWFDKKRGYGFILGQDDDVDYFVHHTAIISEDDYKILHENQKVSFDSDTDDKGRLKAKNVRKIG